MGRKKGPAPTLRQLHLSEYAAWINMLHRCHNPKAYDYPNYGGRGISVAAEWRDYKTGFAQFMKDMESKPSPLHSIERTDNDLGYTADNCEWATRKTQQNNRRPNRQYQLDFGLGHTRYRSPLIQYSGMVKSLTQWAEQFGIKATTLRQRLKRGVPIEAALVPPNRAGVSHPSVIRQITIH